MKRFLITLLLRLVDVPRAPKPNEHTEEFLASAWLNEGFRSYLYARERALEKFLSRGVNGGAVDRENYLLGCGQLQELVNLVNTSKRCYEAKQKKVQDKNSARMV